LSEHDAIKHLKLDNYELIHQGKSCSSKGGLVIYLNNKFESETKMTLNKYDTWEGQVIKVTKGGLRKPNFIANIYRPPNNINEKYRKFTQELIPVLKSLEKIKADAIITGDFNIDLLKINEKEVFSDFFDVMTENSFYPKITLPTRFSNKHGTLINMQSFL
jgi:exonuclease III